MEITKEKESSEYETDEEEEEEEQILFKPVYVPKKQRETISEEDRYRKEQEEAEERDRVNQERKKEESMRLLATQVKKDLLGSGGAGYDTDDNHEDFGGVEDEDDVDVDGEYLAWKLRELERVKRDKEERELYILEVEELERRRGMTDEERLKDDLETGRDRFKKDKSQMRFLQKYFHKGAFYQDLDILKGRDYSGPTAQDEVSKELLPEVMQVKNYGMASRSKWTHLANEDTSRKDAGWYQFNDISEKMVKRMGGMKNEFEKPPTKRRKE